MGLFRRRDIPKPANTTAVILAGGRSERFDGIKGLAKLQGRPLVQWSAGLAAASTVRTVLVIAVDADPAVWRRAIGETRPMVPPKKRGKKIESSLLVVGDERPYRGPAVGLRAALPHLETKFVLLLAVDMPLLRPDLVLGLNDRLVGHDAVAYHLEGWWRPFPSLWKRDALEMALRKAEREGVESLHALFDLVDARPLGPEFLALFDATVDTLKSVNTREDLEAVKARLGGET